MSQSQQHTSTAPGSFDEEIRPYSIHVSSRYLDLTQQKLELTRLPHEINEPAAKDWWAPKTTVEPLIDFWQEQYSWRDTERQLNDSLPQFRTSILIPGSDTPCRIHFIHAPSPHANAVPLLLIPPFPFTNLSLGHLVSLFTDPDDAATTQPFHLVIPSLPGLGFSDALPSNTPLISTTAAIFDTVMNRLDYPQYIATNSAPSEKSPAGIDWKLANHLAHHYSDSCLGLHFISPPLLAPTFGQSALEWFKWKLSMLFQAAIFGYTKQDLGALKRSSVKPRRGADTADTLHFGMRKDGLHEPNTLSYALCDSPAGLLLFFLILTRVLGPLKKFTPTEVITMTELTWLPGPEATLRYWAYCASNPREESKTLAAKPKVAITVFMGDDDNDNQTVSQEDEETLPQPVADRYSCPAWARTRYNVVSSNRVSGRSGLLAWERPEVIVDGARNLAKEILRSDKRMRKSELPGMALLEQVVVGDNQRAAADISGTTIREPLSSHSDVPKELTKKDQTAQPGQDSKFLSPSQAAEPRRSHSSVPSASSIPKASPTSLTTVVDDA